MSGTTGRANELSPRKRALLDLLLCEEQAGSGWDQCIPRRSASGPAPQSFAQQRLWTLEALRPGTPVYTVRTTLRFAGRVDCTALAYSVNEVVRRHEALRTTFTIRNGEPVQIIASALAVDLPVIKVGGTTAQEREAAVQWRVDQEASRPFNLETGPLFRCSLLRIGPDDHVLLLALHHIVADGWSLGILLRELSTIYAASARGEPHALLEPPIQYADYAIWQHRAVATPALRQQITYWTEQLADLPALILPTERARPALPGLAGERQHLTLSREVTDGLKHLSRREGATLFMTLLAVFQVVLARWCGQDDFGVGTPVANRTRAETEDVIGFFLNTLVLRANIGGDPTFLDLLARVRETTLAAYANQDLPFELLLQTMRPARDPSRTPLFQVFFNLLNFADERLNRPVMLADAGTDEDFAQFDLSLYAGEDDHCLQLQLVYRTDLLDTATGSGLLGYLSTLLGKVAENVDRRVSALPLVVPDERRRLAGRHNAVRPELTFEPFCAKAAEQSLSARFAEQVMRHAHRTAVRSRGRGWTYRELDAWTDRVAHAVRQAAPHGGGQIAVLCDHDAPMVAALMAVLRSGHAYVPFDTAHPIDRLMEMVADAQVQTLLADHRNLGTARALAGDRLPVIALEAVAEDPVPDATLPPVSPDAIAYILYTSGSTGRPKGVVQNHRNVLNHIRAYTNGLHIRPEDRLSLLASYGFDAAVMDLYGALLNGATLCLFNIRNEGPLALPEWLDAERVTVYHSTPSIYRQAFEWREAGHALSSVRAVVLGGEEVRLQDVEIFRRCCPPGCLFVNGLGPTESTLALQYVLDRNAPLQGRTVPVGYPVEGTEVLLLNESGEEVGLYGVGTIVIRSPHVALGYWRRPELTRAAFRASPLDARQRLYVTGDLGRLLPDGAIEFAGRRDRQVKIRGHRVEIGEVEALLLSHPATREVLVTEAERPVAGAALVAYVVFHGGKAASDAELQAFLRERLPAHMVPAAIVPLTAFPVTTNGKLDRRGLPVPSFSAPAASARIEPRTNLEATLASLFTALLGVQQVGVTDDFFELGGHSLMATQLLARVRSVLHVEVPLRAVFEAPTVAGLALFVEGLPKVQGEGAAVIDALPRVPPPANKRRL
jgi:amino acid adenylation domain-containing protein